MSNANTKKSPITHRVYVFQKTGSRRGMVFGAWEKSGTGRMESNGDFVGKINMLPIGGWDGRVFFVKHGNKPPVEDEPLPDAEDEDGGGE